MNIFYFGKHVQQLAEGSNEFSYFFKFLWWLANFELVPTGVAAAAARRRHLLIFCWTSQGFFLKRGDSSRDKAYFFPFWKQLCCWEKRKKVEIAVLMWVCVSVSISRWKLDNFQEFTRENRMIKTKACKQQFYACLPLYSLYILLTKKLLPIYYIACFLI